MWEVEKQKFFSKYAITVEEIGYDVRLVTEPSINVA